MHTFAKAAGSSSNRLDGLFIYTTAHLPCSHDQAGAARWIFNKHN